MDRYVLPRAKRLVIRGIALVFFGLGLLELPALPLPSVAPQLIGSGWLPGPVTEARPEALLPEEAQWRLAADPAGHVRFVARLRRPEVRVAHQLLAAVIVMPLLVILFGLGMALWRSTRLTPGAVEEALRWLGAVGWAALFGAVAGPVLDGVRTVVVLRGVIPTPRLLWYDPATEGTTYVLLLVAAGILAATWTISAGLKARADMAAIV